MSEALTQTPIALVVAMAKNRVIGVNNTLPWRLSGDMAYFKQVTMGKPIVMGRNTFDSIGKPLPGRRNIVVTRQADWQHEGVDVAHSLEQALTLADEIAKADKVDEIAVIGGANIYAQALPLAKTLYITEVDCEVDGDAYFPEFGKDQWQESGRVYHQNDIKNQYNFAFVTLMRNYSAR